MTTFETIMRRPPSWGFQDQNTVYYVQKTFKYDTRSDFALTLAASIIKTWASELFAIPYVSGFLSKELDNEITVYFFLHELGVKFNRNNPEDLKRVVYLIEPDHLEIPNILTPEGYDGNGYSVGTVEEFLNKLEIEDKNA